MHSLPEHCRNCAFDVPAVIVVRAGNIIAPECDCLDSEPGEIQLRVTAEEQKSGRCEPAFLVCNACGSEQFVRCHAELADLPVIHIFEKAVQGKSVQIADRGCRNAREIGFVSIAVLEKPEYFAVLGNPALVCALLNPNGASDILIWL